MKEPAPGSWLTAGVAGGKAKLGVHLSGVLVVTSKQSVGGRSPELFFLGNPEVDVQTPRETASPTDSSSVFLKYPVLAEWNSV